QRQTNIERRAFASFRFKPCFTVMKLNQFFHQRQTQTCTGDIKLEGMVFVTLESLPGEVFKVVGNAYAAVCKGDENRLTFFFQFSRNGNLTTRKRIFEGVVRNVVNDLQ